MPAGKSGHLELGYMVGCGKPGYILFDKEPERLDQMVQFATDIFFDAKELGRHLLREHG
jgi:nucleoside 2-deoxyribosyltransferase